MTAEQAAQLKQPGVDHCHASQGPARCCAPSAAGQQLAAELQAGMQAKGIPVTEEAILADTATNNPCTPVQATLTTRVRRLCSNFLGLCKPTSEKDSCIAIASAPGPYPLSPPAQPHAASVPQAGPGDTRLLRAQAVLDELPMMATLMQLDGKVLLQNEASMQYWGCLVPCINLPPSTKWREPCIPEHDKHSLSRCVLGALLASEPELLEDLVTEVIHGYAWRKVLAVSPVPGAVSSPGTLNSTATQDFALPSWKEGTGLSGQVTAGADNTGAAEPRLPSASRKKPSRNVSFSKQLVQNSDGLTSNVAPTVQTGSKAGSLHAGDNPLPGLAATSIGTEVMSVKSQSAATQPTTISDSQTLLYSRSGTQGSSTNATALQLARTRSRAFTRDGSWQLPVAPSAGSLTGADRRSRGAALASAGLAFEPSHKVMSLISKASTATATTGLVTSASTDGDAADPIARQPPRTSRKALPPPPGLIAASHSQPGPAALSKLSGQHIAVVAADAADQRSSAPALPVCTAPLGAAQRSLPCGPCSLADLMVLPASTAEKLLELEQPYRGKLFVHMDSYLSAQQQCNGLGFDDASDDTLEAVLLSAGDQPDLESAHVSDASCLSRRFTSDGGVEGQGPLAGIPPVHAEVCWHEVEALPLTDPVGGSSGEKLLLLLQTDISGRAQLEASMAALTESQLTMLEQMFPRHVLEFMVDPQQAPAQQQQEGCANALATSTSDMNQLARDHTGVTILFTDIVGFTSMSKEVEPAQVMRYLNDLFTRFDCLVDEHGCYKVETAGDCYVAAGGLMQMDAEGFTALDPHPDPTQGARRMLSFAIALVQAARTVLMPHNRLPTAIRVGLHTGNVVTGLIGTKLPKFSLFGDAMNTASRMESTCPHLCIQASSTTYALLGDAAVGFQPTGGVEVKGKGKMETYVLNPAALAANSSASAVQGKQAGGKRRHSTGKPTFSTSSAALKATGAAAARRNSSGAAAARRNSGTAAMRRNSGDILTALRSSAHCLFVTAPTSPPTDNNYSLSPSSPGLRSLGRRELAAQPMNLRSSMQHALQGAGNAALLHHTGQDASRHSSGSGSPPLQMSGWKSGAASRGPSDGGWGTTSHTILPGAIVHADTADLAEAEPGRLSRSSTLSAASQTSRISTANARKNNHPLLNLLRSRVHNSASSIGYAHGGPAAGNQSDAVHDCSATAMISAADSPDAAPARGGISNPFEVQPQGQWPAEPAPASVAHTSPKRNVTFGRSDLPQGGRRPSEGTPTPTACTVAAVAALAGSATRMLAQRPSQQSATSGNTWVRASATNA